MSSCGVKMPRSLRASTSLAKWASVTASGVKVPVRSVAPSAPRAPRTAPFASPATAPTLTRIFRASRPKECSPSIRAETLPRESRLARGVLEGIGSRGCEPREAREYCEKADGTDEGAAFSAGVDCAVGREALRMVTSHTADGVPKRRQIGSADESLASSSSLSSSSSSTSSSSPRMRTLPLESTLTDGGSMPSASIASSSSASA